MDDDTIPDNTLKEIDVKNIVLEQHSTVNLQLCTKALTKKPSIVGSHKGQAYKRRERGKE